MAKYRNVNSGAVVDVRDDKVMDAEWEQQKAAPKKAASAKADSK